MAYSTNTELKVYLGISGTGDDAEMTRLISVADSIIDQSTGTVWVATSVQKFFHAVDDVDGRDLLCGYYTSITYVKNGDGRVLDSSVDYVKWGPGSVYDRVRLLRGGRYSSWNWVGDPTNAIDMVAAWGSAVTVPARVKQLSLRIATWLYRQREMSAVGEMIYSGQGVRLLGADEMPKDIRRELEVLRRGF